MKSPSIHLIVAGAFLLLAVTLAGHLSGQSRTVRVPIGTAIALADREITEAKTRLDVLQGLRHAYATQVRDSVDVPQEWVR